MNKEFENIIQNWSKAQKAGAVLPCPRCGEKMQNDISENALSRRADIYICSPCGTHESLEDMRYNGKLEHHSDEYKEHFIKDWWLVRSVLRREEIKMNCKEGANWLDSLLSVLGQSQYQNLWNFAQALTEIKEMLESERIVEPPCKVGDMVYMPWLWNDTKGIAFLEVTRIILDGNKPYVETDFDTDDDDYSEAYNGGKFYFDDFGETVFLTIFQAKQKLKE